MGYGNRPVLWHIPISHYNEKVRWALDLKGVEHERKAPNPHPPTAIALTRGRHATLPIVRIDGEIVHDSSAIIAALDERYPDPPLYPAADADRRRALDLEEWFDEEAGPHVRRFVWHETTRDKQALGRLASRYAPGPLRRFEPAAGRVMGTFVHLRYGVKNGDRAAESRERVLAAFDRLDAELGDGDYLVGDSFTVADLTAAAILYPIVTPPEGPDLPEPPQALEEFRGPLKERRAYTWVAEMFRRHRNKGASRGQATAPATATQRALRAAGLPARGAGDHATRDSTISRSRAFRRACPSSVASARVSASSTTPAPESDGIPDACTAAARAVT